MKKIFPFLLVHSICLANNLDFNRDVRPILSENCFYCHGVDGNKREADLRLDIRESALASDAFVPGDLNASELFYRIHSEDEDEIMPPPESNRILSTEQKRILEQWIKEGAKYDQHWAFVAPKKKTLPTINRTKWIRNPIDHFVLSKLEERDLMPATEASKPILMKRLYADLIGLPPTPKEVDSFVYDNSANAYEKVVDHLLESPRYGERMALEWLDTARYADSNGFQVDGENFQWVWRDWVVNALNQDMPFDQFTIWQLAGDLLPNATLDQKIASGFNRNHLNNGEGGAIPEEQRFVILFDRIDVTTTTWLGLTMACAQCHDHKYDPITQKDYYSLMDAFNHVSETGRPGNQSKRIRLAAPFVEVPTDTNKKTSEGFRTQITKLQKEIKKSTAKKKNPLFKRTGSFKAQFIRVVNDSPKGFLHLAEVEILSGGKNLAPSGNAIQSSTYARGNAKNAIDGNTGGDFQKNSVTHTKEEKQPWLEIDLGKEQPIDLIRIFNRTDNGVGKRLKEFWVVAYDGKRTPVWARHEKKTPDPKWESSLPPSHDQFSSEDNSSLQSFLANWENGESTKLKKQLKELDKKLKDYRSEFIPKVMVMNDDKKRETHILIRGEYLKKGEPVSFNTPHFLPKMNKDWPNNRLGLAKWLVAPEQPMTARVQVNRMWQRFFGVGLVKTSEDLGVQSEYPLHLDLLDWLAVEFQDLQWSMKKMHRLIVTSSTYRQSSMMNKWQRENDPENRLVHRASRFRLPSMILRDWALASSGLLVNKMGGQPVYPYQPENVWEALSISKNNSFNYPTSKKDDLYRRSLYTFWRRTIGPANMFDSSDRQACRVKPGRTSTPLHALTTLNDPTWVEASRFLAERAMAEKSSLSERIVYAFRLITADLPDPLHQQILEKIYHEQLKIYQSDTSSANDLLTVGKADRNQDLPLAEHAAFTITCLGILNLDQALTRE